MKRGWFGESHRHYLAAKGISTKRYAAGKDMRGPFSFSRFLEGAKGSALQPEIATLNTDYYAVVDQQNAAARDRFYAGKRSGFLKEPYADEEVQMVEEQDIAAMRNDFVSAFNKEMAKSDNLLNSKDRKRALEDFGRLAEDYRSGAIDYETFKKDYKRLKNDALTQKTIKPFGWAKGKDKGADAGGD